jgi:hypothetical protein
VPGAIDADCRGIRRLPVVEFDAGVQKDRFEPLRQLAAPIESEQLEVTMPVALKPAPAIDEAANSKMPWIHLLWFGAAGLFVSILALTYGLDLSPGLY